MTVTLNDIALVCMTNIESVELPPAGMERISPLLESPG